MSFTAYPLFNFAFFYNAGASQEGVDCVFVSVIAVFVSLVVQLTSFCPTVCDPVDCGTPGLPVLHHLPDLAQTHVH